MATRYNLKNIRILLTKGFTDEQLRHFCYDDPKFRTVYDQLSSNTGKSEIVQRLIEYAERKELFDPLLAWAKEKNPAQYQHHQPYYPTSRPALSGGNSPISPSQRGFKWLLPIGGLLLVIVAAGVFFVLRTVPIEPIPPSETAVAEEQAQAAAEIATDTPTVPPTNTALLTNTPVPPTSQGETIIAADGASMVLVPAGPFTMGSNRGADWEKPVHTVTLDAFYIDQYEITNARYAICVDVDACEPPEKSPFGLYQLRDYYGDSEYDDYPVIGVNWFQAITYCEWRGDRLPTEAEWEKAARGIDGRIYPWGNKPPNDTLLNYGANLRELTPVGSYPEGISPYGVYDMAGNVWEWTSSLYEDYPYQAGDGREDPNNSTDPRVLRGGAWDRDGDIVRAAYRENVFTPDSSTNDLGFRCAADVPE